MYLEWEIRWRKSTISSKKPMTSSCCGEETGLGAGSIVERCICFRGLVRLVRSKEAIASVVGGEVPYYRGGESLVAIGERQGRGAGLSMAFQLSKSCLRSSVWVRATEEMYAQLPRDGAAVHWPAETHEGCLSTQKQWMECCLLHGAQIRGP